jgi:hypothetical protein
MRIGKIQGIGELFTVKTKEKADKPKTELWSLKRKLWVLGKKKDRCRYWRRVKIEEDFVVDRNRERERERGGGIVVVCWWKVEDWTLKYEDRCRLPLLMKTEGRVMWSCGLWSVDKWHAAIGLEETYITLLQCNICFCWNRKIDTKIVIFCNFFWFYWFHLILTYFY